MRLGDILEFLHYIPEEEVINAKRGIINFDGIKVAHSCPLAMAETRPVWKRFFRNV